MQPLQLKSIRLSVLVRQVVSDFLNNGLDERYPISLHVQDESLQVMGDERLLYRAVTNLIHNSIRHNPDGCAIVLETSRSAEDLCCEFVVSDDGIGIPKSIWTMWWYSLCLGRVRPSRQGHGLGLPMVSRIAKAHRGRLILTSDSGEGFRAVLQLPAT